MRGVRISCIIVWQGNPEYDYPRMILSVPSALDENIWILGKSEAGKGIFSHFRPGT